MSEAPERIWVEIVPDWQDGDGNDIVGGKWEDFDLTQNGVKYVRADQLDAALAANRELVRQLAEVRNAGDALADALDAFNSAPLASPELKISVHSIDESLTEYRNATTAKEPTE